MCGVYQLAPAHPSYAVNTFWTTTAHQVQDVQPAIVWRAQLRRVSVDLSFGRSVRVWPYREPPLGCVLGYSRGAEYGCVCFARFVAMSAKHNAGVNSGLRIRSFQEVPWSRSLSTMPALLIERDHCSRLTRLPRGALPVLTAAPVLGLACTHLGCHH